MEPQSLLPKAFLDLFEFKFNQIFSEEQLRELDKLPLNIRDTLNDFIRDIQLKHESTREDFLRKKDAYEQMESELESKLQELADTQGKLTLTQAQHNDQERRSSELSEKVIELQSLLIEKEKSWTSKEQDFHTTKSQLESGKRDLNEAIFQKNKEIDRLTTEWKQLSEKLKEAISLRLDAQSQCEEAKSELMIIQNRESKLKSELTQTTHQVTILNEELQAKFEEILAIRKEKSSQLLLLQSEYDELSAKLNHAEQCLELSKNHQEKQEEQIEIYIRKLKEAKDGQSILEEQYRGEISAQNKLIELYKTSMEEAERKVEEMSNAVNELQRLNQDYAGAYSQLKEEKEKLGADLNDQMDERGEQIRILEEELANANQLLEATNRRKSMMELTDEEVEQISPVAAAASKLLKSGMSLTQIYTEYVKVTKELMLEKEERKKASECLDKILKDLEEKAPIMRQQKRDYEKSLEKIDMLTQQLNGALEVASKHQSDAEELFRKNCDLTRKNDRYSHQVMDLSKQVRMLLKELEEERGTIVRLDMGDVPPSQDEVSSSSAVISNRLVTFRSIEELQQKNIQLLEVVRELSTAAESKENVVMDEQNEDLKQQLNRALSEIEEMKVVRAKQTQVIESIIQQRDMYKAMSSQHNISSPRHISTPIRTEKFVDESQLNKSTSNEAVDEALNEKERVEFEALKSSLNELKTEFSTYRKEKCEHERMLNEDLASRTKELSEFRLKSSKLESQLEFMKERFKVLQTNVESHKKEAELLRERNQKMSESVAKHQQIVVMLREELKSCQERAASAEARCNSLQIEKERLKVIEATLTSEAEAVRMEKHTRDVVLRNLEAIQNNLERSEFEVKRRLNQRIDSLEKDNAILRSKVEDSDDQFKSSKYVLERRLMDANEELDRCKLKCSGLEEMVQSSEKLVEHIRSENAILQKKCLEIEAKLAEKERILEGNELHQLLKEEAIKYKEKLDQSSGLLKAKEDELVQVQEHLNQYKDMAESLHLNLKEQNEASIMFKETLEQKLSSMNEALEETKQLKDFLEKKNLELEETNRNLNVQMEDLLEEKNRLSKHALIDPGIVDELEKLKDELKVAKQAQDQAISNERLARKDMEEQANEVQQAHRNYEKELLLHAADVEQLSLLKRELADISNKLHNERSKTSSYDHKIESERNAWIEKELDYTEKVNFLKEKLSSLQNQNTLLYDELDKMTQKMLDIQKQQESEFENMNTQASLVADKETSNQKSTEQLFEVIRFLRREKEIAEAKYEGLEAETVRLRRQSELLKKQLSETEDTLLKEKEKLQIKLQTAAEHAEMLRKIESIHLLQDSNQLLREERDRISAQMRELQMKLVELDSKLGPLEMKCMEFESEKELLEKEIELAREEAGRWKTRTSNLIEQCNKFDPEEFKKAIEERDAMKIQLNSAIEDVQRMSNESARTNQQIVGVQNELQACKAELQKSQEEVASLTNQFAMDVEDKNKTIVQLKKIGRKYRMQVEELQKEIEELKIRAEKAGLITELQAKLSASEQQCHKECEKALQLQKQAEELANKLSVLDSETQLLNKKLKDKETLESTLNGELAQSRQEYVQVMRDKNAIELNFSKLLEEIKKSEDGVRSVSTEIDSLRKEKEQLNMTINWTSEENIRLTEEVAKLSEEKMKLNEDNSKLSDDKKELEKKQNHARNVLLNLKKKLEERNADVERLSKENEEMRKVPFPPAAGSEEGKVCQEQQTNPIGVDVMQQMEEAIQQSSAFRETSERLQRENQDLKQKMAIFQKEFEMLRKQATQQTGKPTLTTPPVERNILPGAPSDVSQRRANIKPMTCNPSASNTTYQQKYSTVQPVRRNTEVLPSTVTMVTIASIRPMAVAQSTPMATVMPTALSVQENESSPTVVMSQSVITSHQIMRPTQQVQPVSHTEESTVSSSGEPGGPSTSQEHAPLPVLSTAGVAPGVVAGEGGSASSVMIGPSGVGPIANSGKRQREESRIQDEPGEHEGEAPHKRLKILVGEAADTTQSVAAGACMTNTLEVEREAASRAQPVDAQQLSQTIMLLRRDSEPVTTSLEGHGNYNNQEDNSRSTPLLGISSAEGSANMATSDELPDYQDPEYDPTNSDPTTSGQMVGDGDEQMMPVRVEDVANVEEDVLGDEEQAMEEGMEQRSQEEDAGADDDVIFVEDDEKFDKDYQEVDSVDYEEEQEMMQEVGNEEIDSEEREDKNYVQHFGEFEVEVKNSDEFDDDNYVQDDDEGSMVNLEDDQGDSMPPLEVLPPVSSSLSAHESGIQQCGLSSETTPLIPPHYMRSSFPQADNPQTSFGGQNNRSLLTSLSFPEGYEVGDDGIVPSTPTNQFINKADVFIEGTQSPRVEEQFPYRDITEGHSGLAHQGDLGVDQTHIDLLDFDEGTSHDLMDNSAGDEGDDQDDLIQHEQEKLENEDTDDDREQLDDSHPHGEHADEFDSSQHSTREDTGDTSIGIVRMPRMHERLSDLASTDKQESQGYQKPKIQKIVWDEPSMPSTQAQAPQTGSSQAPPLIAAGPSGVQTRRAYHLSRGGRGNARAAVTPLLPSEYPQPVPRRGRGSRSGSGSRRHHF